MNQKKELTISTNMRKIMNYIYQHPYCSFKDVLNELDLSRNTLKYYLRGIYDKSTGKYQEPYLMELGHIISTEKEFYGDKAYPTNYLVNQDFLPLYPNLMHKQLIHLQKINERYEKMINTRKEIYEKDRENRPFLYKHTSIKIESERKLYFSNERLNYFQEIIMTLLMEVFYNNPDNWFTLQNPKDMDFKLTITGDWSKEPKIFENLMKRKEICLKDEYLYPTVLTSHQRDMGKEEREEVMKGKSEKDHFNRAFTEHKLRIEKKKSQLN